jgi:thioredoxin 1
MKILRFTASWCGPCKALAKLLEENKTDIPIEVIDIDKNQEASIYYGIRSVPVMIKQDSDGNEISRIMGLPNKDKLVEFLS